MIELRSVSVAEWYLASRPRLGVKLMTVTETAAFLGVSRQLVLQVIEAGQLPAQKVGSMWIVTAEAARAFKKLPRGKAGAPRKLK